MKFCITSSLKLIVPPLFLVSCSSNMPNIINETNYNSVWWHFNSFFVFVSDYWAPVLQLISCSCQALCLCSLAVVPVSWWVTRMCTLLPVRTMNCWMTSSMSRAALEDKLVSLPQTRCFTLTGTDAPSKPLCSAGTLSSIPTALTRWTDECKVLDAESMHDCVAGETISKWVS